MSTATLEISGKKISLPTGLFINGEFRKAQAGKTFPSENPATGKEIIQVQEGQAEDVDEAVRVARKVFRSREYTEFGTMNRSKCLNKLADLMEEHFEQLLAIEMIDTGKTRTQAANLDLPGSIGTIRYFAGYCDKIMGSSNFGINNVFGKYICRWSSILDRHLTYRIVFNAHQKTETCAEASIHMSLGYTKREPVGVCGQIIPWK